MIQRVCSYSAIITMPDDPRTYSSIRVTFAQDQEILITKSEGQLEITDEGFVVRLTQDETRMFHPSLKSPMGRRTGAPVYMQVRAFGGDYDAPGSENFEIDVIDSLSEEVLADG